MTDQALARPEPVPFDANELNTLDSIWSEKFLKAFSNPWENGILPLKIIELICVGLSSACTNMQEAATRSHIRAALKAGATKDEILMVLKMGAVMSIHSVSLGAPILLEEAKEFGLSPTVKQASTPACNKMKQIGQWNTAWDPFYNLDPHWTDQVMDSAVSIYASGVMSSKLVELLSIAFDASITHMYAPGTRRHIKAALKEGATIDEIMEVLKVCVAFGIDACKLSTKILAQELSNFETSSQYSGER